MTRTNEFFPCGTENKTKWGNQIMTVIKFVDNNTTAYRIWQSFQTDIHSTCTEQVTSLYNRINTLRLFFWMYGIVLISLLKLEVYKYLTSKQISLSRVYLLWYLWRVKTIFVLTATKWLHVMSPINLLFWWYYFNRWYIYIPIQILKYSLIRWLVSHVGNSDKIS